MTHHKHLITSILLPLTLLLAASSAAADEPLEESPTPFEHRRIAVEFQTGLFGLSGAAGAGLDIAVHPLIAIEGGGGYGMFGYRAHAAIRARIPLQPGLAISPWLGVAIGPHETLDFSFDDDDGFSYSWDRAIWLATGPSFEYQHEGGLRFRAMLGVQRMLNVQECDCGDAVSGGALSVTVALGYAFGVGSGPVFGNFLE